MTKKKIILSEGEVRYMTFEEVLIQFEPMINSYARRAVNKIVFNKPELEEMKQELYIQAWEAYRRYDEVHAFSTYLVPRLKHGEHKATQKLYTKKRTNTSGTISLNEVVYGDENEQEFEGLLGEEDAELESLQFKELLIKLDNILEPSEKLILYCMINKDEFSVRDLGDKLGISRQGANKKYNKFKQKIAGILIDLGYVTC